MNKYFVNIIEGLEIKSDVLDGPSTDLTDIMETFKEHISIKKIHSKIRTTLFQLDRVSQNDVSIVIKNLCNNKANLHGDIPAQILKLSLDSYVSE